MRNPGHVDWSDVKDPEPVLFSRGSKLSDIPDTFHGMPVARWWKKMILEMITEQCNEYLKTAVPETDAARTDWKNKRVAGPRDNYGWRSL